MIVIEIPRAPARFDFPTSTHLVVVVFLHHSRHERNVVLLYHRRRHPTQIKMTDDLSPLYWSLPTDNRRSRRKFRTRISFDAVPSFSKKFGFWFFFLFSSETELVWMMEFLFCVNVATRLQDRESFFRVAWNIYICRSVNMLINDDPFLLLDIWPVIF